MQLPIVKWGNSAALRLPATLLGQLSAKIGDVFEADLTAEPGALVLRKPSLDLPKGDAAVAAIGYALTQGVDAVEFLCAWMHGEFDAIRKEWPEAPETVFIGADPLYKPANAGGQ